MSTRKISQLTDGTTANGTDKIPVERSSANRYITPAYIWTYIQALTGNMAATARTAVRKNSTGSVYERRRLNLIEGTNVTLTVADDSGSEEVDITIAASGGGGGGYTEGARVFNNSSQSLTAATTLYSDYDTEEYDTDTIHDDVTNTKRLTCKTAGKYLIGGSGRIGGANAGATLNIRIRLNGANLIAISQVPAIGTNDYLNISTVFDLAVNDYLELGFTASAGTSMIVDTQAYYTPEFWMSRIG
jgi:hypothetical protein